VINVKFTETNQMKRQLYRFVFFQLMGWRIIGTVDKAIKKSVLMVLPHTSWHDFYVGLLARGAIGLEMHYVAKKELFRFPFGAYFRWMGGAPIDRTGNLSIVDAIVNVFRSREVFRLAISPEGTRKKVTELKTGFYYIALQADVPIIPIAFDYLKKEVGIGHPFYPTGDYDSDLTVLLQHFKDAKGKIPANGFDVK
jgi:1-acyl-sn-glycerol-3-phosphate acyltransferase